MEIAVLITVFNRKEKTLSCLKSLFNQKLDKKITFKVFLTDDNSSDGTAEAVKHTYPEVNIFKGNGNLFWAGGMRNSWTMALNSNPDYYFLLNDDTFLKENCISSLLKYYSTNTTVPAITIGSTWDSFKNEISYGGHKLYHPKKVPCYNLFSETEFLACDMANANIMLVPKEIVQKIGILSSAYTHSIADFDYTLRAKKAGFKIMVAPGILGLCVDDHPDLQSLAKKSLKQRIAHLKSPKGLAYQEYMAFIGQHFPSHRPAAFVKIWTKTLFPTIWHKLKR
ncbi:glycosyltransferase family 2 protein [Pedobacter rhizosphaerae]|uniref:Glycosyltransferase, GT2 family n=1 Tax=Pedobacter rhizosphaerae TaxID=390241 RepID=A0A1H9SHQ6_9SPHI|nr:glycosyltransferase family 2 protein [Pedobacter rhizosphaerae]SER84517.1 Glycosyltransferase, GT2 family [Pedobacter rhizosphaerae]